MKAEINRRCTPSFNLNNSLTKKERLKELPVDIKDFFEKIFSHNLFINFDSSKNKRCLSEKRLLSEV